jgi:hypothetical protein
MWFMPVRTSFSPIVGEELDYPRTPGCYRANVFVGVKEIIGRAAEVYGEPSLSAPLTINSASTPCTIQ